MQKFLCRLGLCLGLSFFALNAYAGLVEPSLHLPKSNGSAPRVALTLDLCMGKTDHRIFDVLVKEKIKATLFMTGRWITRNPDIIAKIKQHPELFEVANHGANHIPAIDDQATIFGLKTAGSLKAVCEEVEGGEHALSAAGFSPSMWYRDAAAQYSPDAIKLVKSMGYQIAGFSLNADIGASLPATQVAARIAKAKNGDVIIAHMNQPKRQSGAGVAKGILSLKNRGYEFVTLTEGMNFKTSDEPKVSCKKIFGTAQNKQ